VIKAHWDLFAAIYPCFDIWPSLRSPDRQEDCSLGGALGNEPHPDVHATTAADNQDMEPTNRQLGIVCDADAPDNHTEITITLSEGRALRGSFLDMHQEN
jgi:hypothetical protein